LSGVRTLDPLLNKYHQKWSGGSGSLALTYSFPWLEGAAAYWQTDYSSKSEQLADHYSLDSLQVTAVSSVFKLWADVAAITFTQVPDTASNVGDFRVAFSSLVTHEFWGWCYYPDSVSANAADIWINPAHAADTDWSIKSHNFYSLIHEIGHGLGLKHPGSYVDSDSGPYISTALDFRNYSVMSYNDSNVMYLGVNQQNYIRVMPETPMVYDIAAIQYLYGANNTYQAGDNIYNFDPVVPFYKSIWDAGGTDTLDLSNFTTNCDINLIPGNYSSIRYVNQGTGANLYDGSNNLGIAFGTIIEIAVGGSGNDNITGNNVNNFLYGGDGNDMLLGGTGNDFLDGGTGVDTVNFTSARSSYTILPNDIGFSVKDNAGSDGTDFVVHVENLQFHDSMLKLSDFHFMVPMIKNGIGVNPEQYTGPATAACSESIRFQFIGDFSSEVVQGTSYNDFISVGAGDDAVNAGVGNDVIDGGTGSNFLTGGVGSDIYFSDGRGGGVTWSTIMNWEQGEQLSVWGWKPGISQVVIWRQDGAAGYQGITMHADLNGDGIIDTSVTFTGITSQSQLPKPLDQFDNLLWFK